MFPKYLTRLEKVVAAIVVLVVCAALIRVAHNAYKEYALESETLRLLSIRTLDWRPEVSSPQTTTITMTYVFTYPAGVDPQKVNASCSLGGGFVGRDIYLPPKNAEGADALETLRKIFDRDQEMVVGLERDGHFFYGGNVPQEDGHEHVYVHTCRNWEEVEIMLDFHQKSTPGIEVRRIRR